MQHALIAITLTLLVITISGCPKKDATIADTANDNSSSGRTVPLSDNGDEGFIPEPLEQPLSDSPLNLWGFSLGTRLDPHNAEYADTELELTQNWREGELTGIQWRKLNSGSNEAKPETDISYFHNGELVGSQRMVDQTEAEFQAKADLLTTKYGDPITAVPAFVRDSLVFDDLAEGNPSELVLWVDEDTRTAIAGRYDSGEATAMWMLFHPERFDAAQGDTFAGMGS